MNRWNLAAVFEVRDDRLRVIKAIGILLSTPSP